MLNKIVEMKEKTVRKFTSKSGLGAWEIIVGIAVSLVAAGLIIGWMGGSVTDILDTLQGKLMDFFN
ncbi:MAG TPA: hypothetical protein VN381_03580 [Anaerovoracaceae bacterium]|nr:hypothetical protein [Anaerovoracaceae bacterium]